MSAATPGRSLPTIGTVLASGGTALVAALGPVLAAAAEESMASDGQPQLSAEARGLAAVELGAAAVGLTDIDLGGLIVEGWRRLQKVAEAGERTAHRQGPPEPVVLASHEVSATYEPTLDLYVDRVKRATIHLELQATCELETLTLHVQAGRIVGAGVGGAEVTAELSVESKRLLAETMRVDVSAIIPIGQGIPIHMPHR